MAVESKLFYTCYEVAHTWEPSCKRALLGIALRTYLEALKVYLPLYTVTAAVRRKKLLTTKLFCDTLRSTLFLGTNVGAFLAGVCLWRRALGCFTPLSVGFLPGMTACGIAILFERKDRRGMLALYMSNLAVETIYKILVSRGVLVPVHYGEVILFSVVSALYMFLYKSRNGLEGNMLSGIRFLVGPGELPPSIPAVGCSADATSPPAACPASGGDRRPAGQAACGGGTAAARGQHLLPAFVRRLVGAFQRWSRHGLCRHQHGCCYALLKVSVRCFGVGYGLQCALRLLGSIPALARRPAALPGLLTHKHNFRFAAFLASFSALFNGVSCLLRWLCNTDGPLHGLIAGLLAGSSLLFYRSSSVALYLASKLVEILYFKGIDAGLVPYVSSADILLYSLSTAVIARTAILEPHNLRPAYWKFLLKITGGRFAELNRTLLDGFGTDASRLYRDFKPVYDARYTKLK